MKLVLCQLVLVAAQRNGGDGGTAELRGKLADAPTSSGDGGTCQDWTPPSCPPTSSTTDDNLGSPSRAARQARGCPTQLCDINYCTFMPWREVLPDNPNCCCHPKWSCRPRCKTILGTG